MDCLDCKIFTTQVLLMLSNLLVKNAFPQCLSQMKLQDRAVTVSCVLCFKWLHLVPDCMKAVRLKMFHVAQLLWRSKIWWLII